MIYVHLYQKSGIMRLSQNWPETVFVASGEDSLSALLYLPAKFDADLCLGSRDIVGSVSGFSAFFGFSLYENLMI